MYINFTAFLDVNSVNLSKKMLASRVGVVGWFSSWSLNQISNVFYYASVLLLRFICSSGRGLVGHV